MRNKLIILGLSMVLILSGCSNTSNKAAIKDEDINAATMEASASETESGTEAASDSSSESTAATNSEEASQTAPTIVENLEFTALDGTVTSLYDLKDRVIIINFWATWCTYCIQEMPLIDELAKNEKYHLIALDVGEDAETVRAFLKDNQYEMDVYLDEQSVIASHFGVTGFPTTVFLSPNYEYLYAFPGMMDETTLDSILTAIDDYLSK